MGYMDRFDQATAEFSVLQERAQRTNYNQDMQNYQYIANLRSPEIRNTVFDGKFTTPFEFSGTHTLVTGGQYVQGPAYRPEVRKAHQIVTSNSTSVSGRSSARMNGG